ncbi:uncharacterized protein [Rutidosis leptorrhynchoides]|uniref:uncharacterized protein n=1 Tax=Rutidosis leptorrhynchoides TaxID=125765 RepID=UPI003A9A3033
MASTGDSEGSDFDAKVFRHNLTRSDKYNRKGFGHKKETLVLVNQEYTSDIIKTLKENNNEYTWGNVIVKLSDAYGFCWGVEHAVQIAYVARKQFPDETIWITNEIIHNPTITSRATHGLKVCYMFAEGIRRHMDTHFRLMKIPSNFKRSFFDKINRMKISVMVNDLQCLEKLWPFYELNQLGCFGPNFHCISAIMQPQLSVQTICLLRSWRDVQFNILTVTWILCVFVIVRLLCSYVVIFFYIGLGVA